MHNADYPIPLLSDVKELTEFTWYFLKCTDLIASRNAEVLVFNDMIDNAEEEWAEITFQLNNWLITVRGNFLQSNISHTVRNEFAEVEVKLIK